MKSKSASSLSGPLPAGLWDLEGFGILLPAVALAKDWVKVLVALTGVMLQSQNLRVG